MTVNHLSLAFLFPDVGKQSAVAQSGEDPSRCPWGVLFLGNQLHAQVALSSAYSYQEAGFGAEVW